MYKEKLRIRSYCQATPDSTVFVELKKKYDGVVYKRRLSLPDRVAMDWICHESPIGQNTQISREIDYFLSYYESLHPSVFLSYEREAYYARDDDTFRVTFDDHILCRQTELSLTAPIYGTPLLEDGKVLMEVKCAGGMPLWMVHTLSKLGVYKTSFSKYGTAYQTLIFPEIQNQKILYNTKEILANV